MVEITLHFGVERMHHDPLLVFFQRMTTKTNIEIFTEQPLATIAVHVYIGQLVRAELAHKTTAFEGVY